jgi:hypothetical protein
VRQEGDEAGERLIEGKRDISGRIETVMHPNWLRYQCEWDGYAGDCGRAKKGTWCGGYLLICAYDVLVFVECEAEKKRRKTNSQTIPNT